LGVSPTEVDRALLALAAEGRVERMLSESGHTIREVWRIRHAVHVPTAAE
jgi:hypothetical protein